MKRYFWLLCALIISWSSNAKVSAIVEKSEVRYVVSGPNSLTKTEYRRIKILDQDGYKNAVYYSYYDKFIKLRSLQYNIYDANNKRVKKLSKSDAFDVLLTSSVEIADARSVILDPNYQNYPFTVEIEAEFAYNGFLGFDPWFPRAGADIEVKSASLIIQYPPSYQFRRLERNGVKSPERRFDGISDFCIWTVSDMPARSSYAKRKHYYDYEPSVFISPDIFSYGGTDGTFESWSSFGKWYDDINQGRNGLSEATKVELNKFKVHNNGDVSSLVRDVYKYMQSKTRYVSIQLGIGGYQSIPADVVDKNGYGDCKGLSNYLKSMLEYLNVKSNFVLVQAGKDESDVISSFPMFTFNHVFVAVPLPTDTLWLECTSQVLPAFHTGAFTDDRNVLWIDGNNSKLIRSPKYTEEKNVLARNAVINVTESGDATVKLDINKTGIFFDDELAYQVLKKHDLDKVTYARYSYKDFNIANWSFKVPDPQKPILTENALINVARLAQPIQDKLLIPFNPLTPIDKNLDIDQTNKIIEVARGMTLEDHIELATPENFYPDFMPVALKEKNEFGEVEMTVKSNDNKTITISKKAVFYKGIYKNETYDKFSTFLKKVRQAEQSKIVFKNKT